MNDTKKKKTGLVDDSKLKELHKVWGPVEAEIIKSYLESNGIVCIIPLSPKKSRFLFSFFALVSIFLYPPVSFI